MADLAPLEVLHEAATGDGLPLPSELSNLYGQLRFPKAERHVYGNFVSTLDGVVSLVEPGYEGGGPIGGANQHDRMVMGVLRSVADAVVTGAGTLRSVPKHLWTAQHIYPDLAEAYGRLRAKLGKDETPLNVIVTGSGALDPQLRVFQGEVSVLIVTTSAGAQRIDRKSMHESVEIAEVGSEGPIAAAAVLDAIARARPSGLVLAEAGPRLMGDFLAERVLDELFLTLAPQVAGRDASVERPGLVAGKRFAPDDPRWSSLVSVRRGGSHLFLRYSFANV